MHQVYAYRLSSDSRAPSEGQGSFLGQCGGVTPPASARVDPKLSPGPDARRMRQVPAAALILHDDTQKLVPAQLELGDGEAWRAFDCVLTGAAD